MACAAGAGNGGTGRRRMADMDARMRVVNSAASAWVALCLAALVRGAAIVAASSWPAFRLAGLATSGTAGCTSEAAIATASWDRVVRAAKFMVLESRRPQKWPKGKTTTGFMWFRAATIVGICSPVLRWSAYERVHVRVSGRGDDGNGWQERWWWPYIYVCLYVDQGNCTCSMADQTVKLSQFFVSKL